MSEPEDEPSISCLICHAVLGEDRRHIPFCSQRCRWVDLGRWLDGSYMISRPLEQRDTED